MTKAVGPITRRYSVRERFLCSAAAALLLFIGAVMSYLAATDLSVPTVPAFCVSAVFLAGGAVFAKIAMTGTAASFLDRPIFGTVLAPQQPAPAGELVKLLVDCLIAIVVNVVALPLSVLAGAVAIALPLGFFGVYLLIVGSYAYFQLRKGRRRRAVLVFSIAVIVVIIAAMTIRVA